MSRKYVDYINPEKSNDLRSILETTNLLGY
jgi:hypothetical protein